MSRSLLAGRTRSFVDRLARRAHAFHRLAHHPLCERYASELIPLGRKARVCRGCTYAALGSAGGALSALWLRPGLAVLGPSAALGVGLLLCSLTLRLPKSLGRGLACAAASWAALGGLLGQGLWPRLFSLFLLAVGAAFLWRYRRRGPNRGPCAQCPERLLPVVCSGLRPIVQRERAFRRLAQRFIDQAALGRN